MGCCNSNPLGLATAPKELQATKINKTALKVIHGDITLEVVDVIVNSANTNLHHKGGVAEAIVLKGGPVIQEESYKFTKIHKAVPVGNFAVTGPGRLSCKYIIHAVGPIYVDGNKNEVEHLAEVIANVLEEAQKLPAKSISFPAISSGIFSFPKPECAKIFFSTIGTFLEKNPNTCIEEIRLTNNDFLTAKTFEDEFIRRYKN